MSNFYLSDGNKFYGVTEKGFGFIELNFINDSFEIMTFKDKESVFNHFKSLNIQLYENSKYPKYLYVITDDGRVSNFANLIPLKTLTIKHEQINHIESIRNIIHKLNLDQKYELKNNLQGLVYHIEDLINDPTIK